MVVVQPYTVSGCRSRWNVGGFALHQQRRELETPNTETKESRQEWPSRSSHAILLEEQEELFLFLY